jgi:dipeptidase E
MRLYLSSFKLGNQPARLVSLVGRGKRVALIMNALDNGQEARDKWLASQMEALHQLGFVVEELDLRVKAVG